MIGCQIKRHVPFEGYHDHDNAIHIMMQITFALTQILKHAQINHFMPYFIFYLCFCVKMHFGIHLIADKRLTFLSSNIEKCSINLIFTGMCNICIEGKHWYILGVSTA